jgi:hypothetical protein
MRDIILVVYHSSYMQVEEENIETGLCVGVLKQVIFVFYWLQGTCMENSSSTKVSCYFIHYVVDLCDDIYVCIEEYKLLEALVTSVITTSYGLR